MSLFSKKEDYDISSSKLGDESPEFTTKGGMSHKTDSEGKSHTTYYDAETNIRTSYDTDADGNVTGHHSTDQNKPKGDPDRH